MLLLIKLLCSSVPFFLPALQLVLPLTLSFCAQWLLYVHKGLFTMKHVNNEYENVKKVYQCNATLTHLQDSVNVHIYPDPDLSLTPSPFSKWMTDSAVSHNIRFELGESLTWLILQYQLLCSIPVCNWSVSWRSVGLAGPHYYRVLSQCDAAFLQIPIIMAVRPSRYF